jgi:hypothetical protein
MDFIDFMVDSSDEYLTGTFYARRPKTVEDGGINFTYKQLDPNSKRFGKVLGNVRADVANYAIATNDHCGFNIGGYIVTQNGLIWQITEIVTNEEIKGKSDVLRWFTSAENSEQSLRMIQVDNLFEIEESYNKWCDITVNFGYINIASIHIWTNDAPTDNVEYTTDAMDGERVMFRVEKGVAVTLNVDYYYDGALTSKRFVISALRTQKDNYATAYNVVG